MQSGASSGVRWEGYAMNLIESLLGYRPFASELEIRESIMKSRGRDAPSEPLHDASSLLIFETSRQHT